MEMEQAHQQYQEEIPENEMQHYGEEMDPDQQEMEDPGEDEHVYEDQGED